MLTTNILILAAGQVTYDTHSGGYPLCLTELEGVSLLELIVGSTRNVNATPQQRRYAFALLDKDIQRYHLDKIARLLAPGAAVVRIAEGTRGSACTSLLAASQLDPESELLIISANEFVELDLGVVISDFRRRALDAGTLIFRSVHPRYSYVRLNAQGLVTEASQQTPISQNATAGIFWFAKTRAFVESAKGLIRKDASVNGSFFVAPTFNELILRQANIGVVSIEPARYHPLKTETQLIQFERKGAA